MIRFDAEQVALSVIKFATGQLGYVIAAEDFDRLAYANIRSARDRLHESCQLFESSDNCELHEDIYLPLFDALSLTTQAIRTRVWSRQLASSARSTLEALRVLILRGRESAEMARMTNPDRDLSYVELGEKEGGADHA